jgi:hypothetical protein
MSSGGCPGPSSSTARTAPRPGGSDGDPDRARRLGLWRIGVVDEDHHELAEPGGIAGHDRGLWIDDDTDAAVGGGLGERRRGVGATSPRSTGTRSSETAPESERASRSRSSTSASGGETSASMSVERLGHLGDGLLGGAGGARRSSG